MTPIVSLGVLPGIMDGALIMVAVTGMFLLHRLVMTVAPWPSQQTAPPPRGVYFYRQRR